MWLHSGYMMCWAVARRLRVGYVTGLQEVRVQLDEALIHAARDFARRIAPPAAPSVSTRALARHTSLHSVLVEQLPLHLERKRPWYVTSTM